VRTLLKGLLSSRRPFSFGIAILVVLLMASTSLTLFHFNKKTTVLAASNGSSFTFTAAGDYNQTSATTANLNYIAHSGASFNLGLGDFNYNSAVTASQWSTYAKGLLPTNFPFEVIPGDQDGGQLATYATNLPNHITGMQGAYGEQYYFDYPTSAPLARFIVFSPYILSQFNYMQGGAGYNWVSSTIDAARAANIPWVIVGMYENCFSLNSLHCSNDDILNLLISKKVDLIIYAHKHDYEASKQLAFNSNCTSMSTTYNASCVVNTTNNMTQGAGSAIVITGTGGATMDTVSTTDPAISYFRSWEASNNNQTWGVSQFTVSANQVSMQFKGTSGGTFSDSLTITGHGPRPTPSPSPTKTPSPTSTPSPGTVPLNTNWFFAEGRVGKGFREYLTIGNPTTNACSVTIQYLYTMDGSVTPANKSVTVNVAAATRLTESVNNDLQLPDFSASAASLAAIVTVNTQMTPNCAGVVAERPMYFTNFHGISSGTDVVGGTTMSNAYYFADVPTGTNYTSYITVLNPNTIAANVVVSYFANGSRVQTQNVSIPAQTRGTIAPGTLTIPSHVAAVVTSNEPILVERPTYFTNVNGISGAYDLVGAQQTGSDWLFAEGYTGSGYQEYLTMANLDAANSAAVTITLKSGTGATKATQLSLGPQSQIIWNVNTANAFPGSTPEVSAEVTAASSGPGIVVQREIYFTYKHTLPQQTMGGTDVMGQMGPAAHSTYSFAEGYTNTGYNEWLTIQNPTTKDETISVILVNGSGKTSTQTFTVHANSRFTQDINALVQQIFNPGTSNSSNAVSMTVQTSDGSVFVAERPMYWNTSGISSFVTKGGSDVIGYVGG
jgi:hypothetical protein